MSWDSKTWVGVGDIGEIDRIAEGHDLTDARTTVALWLAGDNIDVVDVEDSRGRLAIITILVLDDQGTNIGAVEFRNTMGAVNVEAVQRTDEQGRRSVQERLALELLTETSNLDQTYFVRMTYEAGLRILSGDNGLEFVSDPEMSNLGGFRQVRPGPGEPGGRRLRENEFIP